MDFRRSSGLPRQKQKLGFQLAICEFNMQIGVLDGNTAQQIPRIDFDRFLNGSANERWHVASSIDAAFGSHGFVYLSNHGIDGDVIDECFAWVLPRFPSCST